MHTDGAHEVVTPDELARRALRALRAAPRPKGTNDPFRVVLLLGPDASPVKAAEFSRAVRRALSQDAELRGTRVAVQRSRAFPESRVEIENRAHAPRI